MSWWNIPIDKFGTKQKKIQLTNENKKIKRESKANRRAHSIKDVKKNRQVLDQQAAIKIKNIQDIIIKFSIIDNTNLLAAKAVQNELFDNTFTALIFIKNFKDKIFEVGS